MRRALTIFALVLVAALTVAAQDGPRPVGYLAEFRVLPGEGEQFVDLVKKYDKPLFDGLAAEGVVLAWGLDTPVVHQEGGMTHMLWWVTADFAGMDRVFAGFAAMEVSDEDEKAFQEIIDHNKHHDHLVRSIIVNVSEDEPAGRTYTVWSFVQVKRGKGSEWRKLFEKYTKPVLDQLVADGDLVGYGVDVEWIHTDDPGWRAIWAVTTSMAAFDKLDAAFRAAGQARSEEERGAIGHMFRKITKGSSHRDSLWRSISLDD
ncbi:MAG: hypothetical protein ACE5HB_04250 [Terriglobia bacterium]